MSVANKKVSELQPGDYLPAFGTVILTRVAQIEVLITGKIPLYLNPNDEVEVWE
ncbi:MULTISPECIES: hypothetical protein [Mycobacteroides]|jgi:hypothetical protein|uniref:hypothetical protein n=1 Tax=Mycobacteroides TaxID=670516 RepID=UPI000929A2DA|nr:MULTISPECIES: hypothetical protein [Mycobacteroides]MBV6360512.1 hypothetical protein [Mycobacteroides chelonae]SHW95145.1 Uncharacterised protein [Mycobacteroides abscessus subsp. abscessus]SKL77755.1 Uncharacterised protein [Mycobacteroides abscessus subsp. abscessus]SKM54965.1 Uncharacterised protein [Mycobacteroides abscessus subsp. abscessus]SLK36051.1 Uncharacterised protein [Mycobacteroides abscessus subsp. abscessus]